MRYVSTIPKPTKKNPEILRIWCMHNLFAPILPVNLEEFLLCAKKGGVWDLSLWKIDKPTAVYFIYKQCCKPIFYSKKVESGIMFITCRLSIQISGGREARCMGMTKTSIFSNVKKTWALNRACSRRLIKSIKGYPWWVNREELKYHWWINKLQN